MTSMGRTASRGRAAGPLAVLAVLLGLLAMHGLASTHHAAAAAPAPHAVLPLADQAAGPEHHHGAAPAATSAAQQDAVALTTGPGVSCDEDCPDLMVLCVAVLTGVALALLLTRRRPSPLLLALPRPGAPTPGPPVRRARGPDPVKELCVSRT